MPRYLKILIWVLSGVALLFAIGLIAMTITNWNWARPWANRQLSNLAHRQVQIDGNLEINWRRQTDLEGWHRLIPQPAIRAQNVTVGNPDWATSGPTMMQAEVLQAQVNLFALNRHLVRLPDLNIRGGRLVLERRDDGTNNWTFGADKGSSESGWEVQVDHLRLDDASVRVLDPLHELDVTINASTSASDAVGYSTRWAAQGSYRGAEVSGEGKMGHVLALREGDDAFPVLGTAHVGSTTISIDGTVTRPRDISALDVNLELSGPTMADLYLLFGVVLPETPSYKTQGRLTARLDGEPHVWSYEQFSGTVGDSDVNGTLTYRVQDPRPVLSGDVESRLLNFKDLGPLIGAPTVDDGSNEVTSKTGIVTESPKGRLTEKVPEPPANKTLPVAKADTHLWNAMDAQVSFVGKRIISNPDLPLDNVEGQVALTSGVLKLKPLSFGVAGGTLKSTIVLDGTKDVIHAKVDAQARGLRLDRLFPAVKSMDAALGTVHGDIHLSGRGNSVSELLKHADGDVRAVVSKGTVSHFLLEAAGLNIANMVFLKLFGDQQIILQCLVAELRVDDGMMRTRTFILETDDAVVTVDGTINLASEEMNLDIHPDNKSLRIFTLRSPLYVRGTFKDPDVGVQKGPLATRAGAAAALGIIATPLAALLPLLNLGTDDTTTCVTVGRQNDKRASTLNGDTTRLRGSVPGVKPTPHIQP